MLFKTFKAFLRTLRPDEYASFPSNIQNIIRTLQNKIEAGTATEEDVNTAIEQLLNVPGIDSSDTFTKKLTQYKPQDESEITDFAKNTFERIIRAQKTEQQKDKKLKVTEEELMAVAKLYFFIVQIHSYKFKNKKLVSLFDAASTLANAYMLLHLLSKKTNLLKKMAGDSEARKHFFKEIALSKDKSDTEVTPVINEFVTKNTSDENHFLVTLFRNLLVVNGEKILRPAALKQDIKINTRAFLLNILKPFFDLSADIKEKFLLEGLFHHLKDNSTALKIAINNFKRDEESLLLDLKKSMHEPFGSLEILQRWFNERYLIASNDLLTKNATARLWYNITAVISSFCSKITTVPAQMSYRKACKIILDACLESGVNFSFTSASNLESVLCELLKYLNEDKAKDDKQLYIKIQALLEQSCDENTKYFFDLLLSSSNMIGNNPALVFTTETAAVTASLSIPSAFLKRSVHSSEVIPVAKAKETQGDTSKIASGQARVKVATVPIKEDINFTQWLLLIFTPFFKALASQKNIFIENIIYFKKNKHDPNLMDWAISRFNLNEEKLKKNLNDVDGKNFNDVMTILNQWFLPDNLTETTKTFHENRSEVIELWYSIFLLVNNLDVKKNVKNNTVSYSMVIKVITASYLTFINEMPTHSNLARESLVKKLQELTKSITNKKTTDAIIWQKVQEIIAFEPEVQNKFFSNLFQQCNVLVYGNASSPSDAKLKSSIKTTEKAENSSPKEKNKLRFNEDSLPKPPAAAGSSEVELAKQQSTVVQPSDNDPDSESTNENEGANTRQRAATVRSDIQALIQTRRTAVQQKKAVRVKSTAPIVSVGFFGGKQIMLSPAAKAIQIDEKANYTSGATLYDLLKLKKEDVKSFLLKLSKVQQKQLLPEMLQEFTIKSRFTVDTFNHKEVYKKNYSNVDDYDDKKLQESLEKMGVSAESYEKIHAQHTIIFTEYASAQQCKLQEEKSASGISKETRKRFDKAKAKAEEFCANSDVYTIFVIKYCERSISPIAAILYLKATNQDVTIWTENKDRKLVVLQDTQSNRVNPAKINLYHRGGNEFENLDVLNVADAPVVSSAPKPSYV